MRFGLGNRRHPKQLAAAVAAALALVVLGDATQAGARYVYCRAMDQVMQHACCKHESTPSRAPVLARTSACCESRAVQSLAPCTSVSPARELPPAALAVLTAPASAETLAAPPARWQAFDDRMRTGPPPGRARARLMIFLL